MDAASFVDDIRSNAIGPEEAVRRIAAMDSAAQSAVRTEVVQRFTAGELPLGLTFGVLSIVGIEPAVPQLLHVLRSDEYPMPARAATLFMLRQTDVDLAGEVRQLDRNTAGELLELGMALEAETQLAAFRGTPFEDLASFDPEEDDELAERIEPLLDEFLASPEAAGSPHADAFGGWVFDLIRLGMDYGYGIPVLWDAGQVTEIVTELLPRKLTIDDASEAETAVPAFRSFFRWASRIVPVPQAEEIDAVLARVERDFPRMMMDLALAGPAKSFVLAGRAAGFDMDSEEGLHAFQERWNAQHALPRPDASQRKKQDAAKKRKAKMAKLSRRKNRRKK